MKSKYKQMTQQVWSQAQASRKAHYETKTNRLQKV